MNKKIGILFDINESVSKYLQLTIVKRERMIVNAVESKYKSSTSFRCCFRCNFQQI